MAFSIVDGKAVVTEARPDKQTVYTLEELENQLSMVNSQIGGLTTKKESLEEMIAALQELTE